MEKIECQCGCKKLIPSRDKRGRLRYWYKGHNRRGKECPQWVKENNRIVHLGTTLSKEQRLKISLANKGRKASQETRERIRQAKIGSKNPQWKGGITEIIVNIRNLSAYREWREKVFQRDGYKCVECEASTGKKDKWRNFLNADHIIPISQRIDLAFDIDNGRTLCVWCHRKTPTWGVNAKYYNK